MKVTVRKGLNINLEGAPEKVIAESAPVEIVSIKPTDFPTLTPKLLLK